MSLKLKMKSKIQILRCEGFNHKESSLGCYILVNQELVDVITPLKSSDLSSDQIPFTEIPSDGLLKLIVKEMHKDSLYLGSLSLPIQSLPSKGFVWLPISQEMDNDTVNVLKDTKSSTRLLISIEKPPSNISSTSLYQLQIKKFEFIISQLEERLKENTQFFEQEKKARSTLASAYEQLQRQHEEFVNKSEKREQSLLSLLEKKDQELQESFCKFKDLRNRYDTVKLEKNHLGEQLQYFKQHTSLKVVEGFCEEIDGLKRTIREIREKDKKCGQVVDGLGKDWLDALKGLGITKKVTVEDLESCDKLEEFQLKAQILSLTEKNNALTERVKKLESDKTGLISEIMDNENTGGKVPKRSEKENQIFSGRLQN